MEIPYLSPLLGNIRQVLAGLHGYDAMALELIQNADDAGATEINFNICDDALRVWNDGQFSSCGMDEAQCPWQERGGPNGEKRACDFHAISMVGSANKYGDSSLIGRFGIGFISVYQITDNPLIHSDSTQIQLDPSRATSTVTSGLAISGSEIELPWAFDENSPTRRALFASPVSTVITDHVQDGLISVTEKCLFFLRHLKSIEILRNGKRVKRVRLERRGAASLRLTSEPDGREENWHIIMANAGDEARTLEQRFHVLTRLKRQTDIQVAFCLDGMEAVDGRVFAYLPTDQASHLPCHINGDFFPEQDRQSIILSGEQHERYWNEVLLGAAARAIAHNLTDLKEVLRAKTLWTMISAAFDVSESSKFGVFWEHIKEAVCRSEVVWTSDERWVKAPGSRTPIRDISSTEEAALSRIGIDLVHDDIRRYQNALLAVGARRLDLASVVEGLELWQEVLRVEDLEGDRKNRDKNIEPLWSVVEKLYPESDDDTKGDKVTRLNAIKFVPDSDGGHLSIDDLYRVPDGTDGTMISEFFPDISLVIPEFRKYPKFHRSIDVLDFPAFAEEIAARLKTPEDSLEQLGEDITRLKRFYRILASYPRDESVTDPGSSLKDVPFLAGQKRFLSSRQAVFPGGFKDPIGQFDILDPDHFDAHAQEFLREVLGVETLSIEAYIRKHLEGLLAAGITPEQYEALISELVRNNRVLDDDDIRKVLESLPLAITVDGGFARPSETYLKTPELMELLGNIESAWLDESTLPKAQRDFAITLFERLGLRRTPSRAHIVQHIEDITSSSPDKRNREVIGQLLRFLSSHFEGWKRDDENLSDLDTLKSSAWLPATIEGEDDEENWYEPDEIYQPFRAVGFDSQVAFLSIRGSRSAPLKGEFFDFLGIPAEPSTAVVVAHLKHCMDHKKPANDTTYQILFERLGNEDDIAQIDQLIGTTCIYNPASGRYLRPDQVFWSRPHLGQYWVHASERMRAQYEFFSHLGVREEPDIHAYAKVVLDIAQEYGGHAEELPSEVRRIHEKCLDAIAQALQESPDAAEKVLGDLEDTPCLITEARSLAFPYEVALRDSDWLAEPFEGELLGRLVKARHEWRELFRRLRIKTLSHVVELEAVRLSDCVANDDAVARVKERTELLGWLLADTSKRVQRRVIKAFQTIEIFSTDVLRVRSKFTLVNPPVVSTPKDVLGFFERESNKLYIHADARSSFWSHVFKAIFFTLLSGDDVGDIRQLVFIANTVAKAGSLEEARAELQEAGFAPPSDDQQVDVDLEGEDLGEFSDVDDDEGSESLAADEEEKADEDVAQEEARDDEAHTLVGPSEAEAEPSEAEKVSDGTGQGRDKGDRTNTGQGDRSRKPGDDKSTGQSRKPGETRDRRTDWMRSYVYPKGKEIGDAAGDGGADQELRDAIDQAAMGAALEYEKTRNFEVERMPHHNPGFDIKSWNTETNEKRLIEVKGLRDEWTGRGVKLSRTQIMNAEEYGDQYWLYVVEFATDPKQRKINAIQNPFFKASEFWFDYVWKDVADEHGGDLKSRFVPGKKVKVDPWGIGEIIEVTHRGIATNLLIEFPIHGRRFLAFNASQMDLVED